MKRFRFAAVLAIALPAAAAGSQCSVHEDKASTMKAEAAVEAGAVVAAAADTASLQGEIVDIACYFRHDSKGPEHTSCAVYCANLGMPMAFLEEGTGKLFVVLPSGHADPKEAVLAHLGQKVDVEGVLTASGGLTGIEITGIRPAAAGPASPPKMEGHSEH